MLFWLFVAIVIGVCVGVVLGLNEFQGRLF